MTKPVVVIGAELWIKIEANLILRAKTEFEPTWKFEKTQIAAITCTGNGDQPKLINGLCAARGGLRI